MFSLYFCEENMVSEKINEGNFLVYAMHHYDNPQCHSLAEFEEDLKKFLYLKKLLSRYKNNGELRERLILNHIIVLYNIFGDAATRMLFHKIEESCWDALITFLVYLDRMPESLPEFNIVLSEIVLDETIIAILRKI
jgi:hypothetical protein